MPLPSIGSWPRATECPGSEALTHHRTENEAGTKGIVIHAYLCDVLQVGKDEAIERVPPEHRDAANELDLDELPVSDPKAWAPEVQVVFNVVTEEAREVGRGDNDKLHFGERKANETRGIMDVAGLTGDGDGVVYIDYKTGWAKQNAYESWQMRMGALALARLWKRDYAIATILRLGPQGKVFKSTARFEAFDLDGFLEEARVTARRVEDAHRLVAANGIRYVKTSAGSWCRNCPALSSCPQMVQLAMQLAHNPDLMELELERMLTPEQASLAWERLDVIDILSKKIRSGLFAVGGSTPFKLRNGLVVGPTYKTRPKIHGEGAHAHLVEKLGREHADLALQKKVTKKGVHTAARSWAKVNGKKIGETNDATLAELKAKKLLVDVKKINVEAHAPGKDDEAALDAYLTGQTDHTLQQQLEASVAAMGGGAAPDAEEGDEDDPF